MVSSRPLRTLTLLAIGALCALLCASVLVVSPAPAAQPVGFGRLTPPVEKPLAGVGFDLSGKMSSKIKGRPVHLQSRTRHGWDTLASTTTWRSGKFRFRGVTLTQDTTVRARARQWRPDRTGRRVKAPIVTRPLTIEVIAAQQGTLTLLPGVAQRGPHPGNPIDPATGNALVAKFVPARPGRVVAFQQQTLSGWTTIATSSQDPSGHADFTVTDTTGTYRALARPVKTHGGRLPAVATQPVATRDWTLLFEDTFSEGIVNPAVWSDQMRDSQGVAATNRKCARISPATRHVTDGVLHLGIAENPTQGGKQCRWTNTTTGETGLHPHMWNSQIMTRGTFEFTYGIAAARMKVQQAKGMHSAFWLQPHDPQHGHPSLGTEIDVMEFFGQTRRGNEGIAAFTHWYDETAKHHKNGGIFPQTAAMKPAGSNWWDQFHVFSVEWTPSAYIFRVDGREFHRETYAVSQNPEYLLLSMLTGDYELAELTREEWSQTAQVDWVRVWAPR